MSDLCTLSSPETGTQDKQKTAKDEIQIMTRTERIECSWLDDFVWNGEPLWKEEPARICKGTVKGGDGIETLFHTGSGPYSFKYK